MFFSFHFKLLSSKILLLLHSEAKVPSLRHWLQVVSRWLFIILNYSEQQKRDCVKTTPGSKDLKDCGSWCATVGGQQTTCWLNPRLTDSSIFEWKSLGLQSLESGSKYLRHGVITWPLSNSGRCKWGIQGRLVVCTIQRDTSFFGFALTHNMHLVEG